MTYALALAWAIGAAMLLKVAVAITVQVRPGAATDIVNLGACQILIFTLGIVAMLRLHNPDAPALRALAIRSTHPLLSVLGLALGFAVHFPAESIRSVMERSFPTPNEVLAARAALLDAGSPLRAALVLLVVACFGPLVEELFFRGALFTALRRSHSMVGASVATALAFVFGHLDFRMWLPLMVVSVVLTFLRAASGSLLPSVALHVGFNTVTVLSLVTGAASIGSPMTLQPAVLFAGSVMTLGLVLAVQYVSSRSEEAARARAEDEID